MGFLSNNREGNFQTKMRNNDLQKFGDRIQPGSQHCRLIIYEQFLAMSSVDSFMVLGDSNQNLYFSASRIYFLRKS